MGQDSWEHQIADDARDGNGRLGGPPYSPPTRRRDSRSSASYPNDRGPDRRIVPQAAREYDRAAGRRHHRIENSTRGIVSRSPNRITPLVSATIADARTRFVAEAGPRLELPLRSSGDLKQKCGRGAGAWSTCLVVRASGSWDGLGLWVPNLPTAKLLQVSGSNP